MVLDFDTECSNWKMSLVNFNQTPYERRAKYALCRYLGDTRVQAERRRDWRWNKIARVHSYANFKTMQKLLAGE